MRKGRPTVAAERAALVVILLPTELTDRAIARLAGVSHHTVRKIRDGGVRISPSGVAVDLGPGEFFAPRPMRCDGCRALCEQFPCRACGACPSAEGLIAEARASGLVDRELAGRRRGDRDNPRRERKHREPRRDAQSDRRANPGQRSLFGGL